MARNETDEERLNASLASGLSIAKYAFILILILILIFNAVYQIDAGQRGVLLTFGNPDLNAKAEGLHFKWPIIQTVIKMDIKTQKYEADASAASKDLQTVTSKIATNYHLTPDSVPILYKEIGINYQDRVIQPLEQEIVKATTAKFTAEELITKREEVRLDIKNTLHDRLLPRGIIVEEVSIVNFEFSPSFSSAIENKVTQEQNALAAKNKLAQIEYEAQQRITQAQGEAEAIKIQATAINSQGGRDYVQLQAISKWSGVMPQFVGGNAMPFIGVNIGETIAK
jgi:regulator of protease activity HflC (stomatin/prohibitin superfamily)